MSDVYGCETNVNGSWLGLMERHVRLDDICRAIFCWGVSESLRSVIVPRTPMRCCSGSRRTCRSYLVKVNASRSSAGLQTLRPQSKHRTPRNFMQTFAAAGGRFRREPQPPLPTHSMRSEERRVGKE